VKRVLWRSAVLAFGLWAGTMMTGCLVEEDAPIPPPDRAFGWTVYMPQKVGPAPDQIDHQAAVAIAYAGEIQDIHDSDALVHQGLQNHDLTSFDKAISIMPSNQWAHETKVAELVAQGKNAEAIEAASQLRAVVDRRISSFDGGKSRDRAYYTGLMNGLDASIKSRPADQFPEERKRLIAQFCKTLSEFSGGFGGSEAAPYLKFVPEKC